MAINLLSYRVSSLFTVILIHAILQKDGIKRGNARTQWEEEEKEMKRLFQKGAELSYLEGLIDGDTKQKYFMSGTFMS